MSDPCRTIGAMRQDLLRARRAGRADLLREVVAGVEELGRQGYRCCLVDYRSCRPAFYVRLLGFESPRVRAHLEFPIAPGFEAVQLLPLSHLVDYDEAADPVALRRIYEEVAEFLHHQTVPLEPSRGARRGRPSRRRVDGRLRGGRRASRLALRRRGAGHSRRPGPVRRVLLAAGVWWGIAGVLLSYGLFVFLVL